MMTHVRFEMALLTLTVALAPAVADARTDDDPPPTVAHESSEGGSSFRWLGISLDGGFPDFAGASLVIRPLSFLRLQGGVLYNGIVTGYRAGLTLRPSWTIAPSLSLDVGRLPEADLVARLGQKVPIPQEYQAALEKVGYSYGTASAGLELGSPNGMIFFVHAGMSKATFSSAATVEGLQRAVDDLGNAKLKSLVRTSGNTAIFPSVKAGFLLYF